MTCFPQIPRTNTLLRPSSPTTPPPSKKKSMEHPEITMTQKPKTMKPKTQKSETQRPLTLILTMKW